MCEDVKYNNFTFPQFDLLYLVLLPYWSSLTSECVITHYADNILITYLTHSRSLLNANLKHVFCFTDVLKTEIRASLVYSINNTVGAMRIRNSMSTLKA